MYAKKPQTRPGHSMDQYAIDDFEPGYNKKYSNPMRDYAVGEPNERGSIDDNRHYVESKEGWTEQDSADTGLVMREPL